MVAALIAGKLLAYGILGAAGNRIRGGAINLGGDTQARIVGWALPMAAVTGFERGWGWGALLMGLAAFAGTLWGEFGGLSMGHRGHAPYAPPSWLRRAPGPLARALGAAGAWLTARPWAAMESFGLARVALPAILLVCWGLQPWLLLIAGIVTPTIYDLAWYVPPSFLLPYLGRGTGPPAGYDPPQLAEAISGFLLMDGLAASLMLIGG